MLALLNYRMYRLRRLVALALIGTLPALFWVANGIATPELYAVTLIALLPALHVMIYPGAWMETISAIVGSLFVIFATPLLDFLLPAYPRFLWFALLLCGGMLVFCAMIGLFNLFVMNGPPRQVKLHTSAFSKCDAAALKAGITLYPGRSDEWVTCGPADENGLFRTTLHIQPIESHGEVEFKPMPDTAHSYTEDGLLETEAYLTCKVEKSTDTEHHVVFHMGEETWPGSVIHTFEETSDGTVVSVSEHSQDMSIFVVWGMWLEDYFADHLQSEIERVEGAAFISNRNRPLRQFTVDLANLMTPRSGQNRPH